MIFFLFFRITKTKSTAFKTVKAFFPMYCQAINNSTRPYLYDNIVIVVPSRNITDQHELIFRSTIIILWIVAAFVFMLFRKCFQYINRSPKIGMQHLFFDSLSLTIGSNTFIRIQNHPERILNAFISIFSLITSLLFSSYLFQHLTTNESTKNMDTLKELGESQIPLLVNVRTSNYELIKELTE